MPRKQQRQQTITEMVAAQRLVANSKAKRRRLAALCSSSSSSSDEEQDAETNSNNSTNGGSSEGRVPCREAEQPHQVVTPADNKEYIIAREPNEEVVYPVTLEEFRKYTYCERKVDEIVKEMWETNRELMEEHSKSYEDLHDNFLEALYERFYTFPLKVRNKFNLKLKRCGPKIRQRVLARAYIRVVNPSNSKNNRSMRNRKEKTKIELQPKVKQRRKLYQKKDTLQQHFQNETVKAQITSRSISDSDSDSERESRALLPVNTHEPQNASTHTANSIGTQNVACVNIAQDTMDVACSRSTTSVAPINNDDADNDNYITPTDFTTSIDTIASPTSSLQVKRKRSFDKSTPHKLVEMERDPDEDIAVLLRRKKCRRSLNVDSLDSQLHLESQIDELETQKGHGYCSSDTEEFVPILPAIENNKHVQQLVAIAEENSQPQALAVANANQESLSAKENNTATSKSSSVTSATQTEQCVAMQSNNFPPQTTNVHDSAEKETTLQGLADNKSSELAVKYREFLKDPNLDAYTEKFPVSLATFIHTTHCADIVDGIMEELGFEKNDETLRDRVLKNYYRQFYMNPKIRANYPLKIKACPKSLKEKIFGMSLGKAFETCAARMSGLKQQTSQDHNVNSISNATTVQNCETAPLKHHSTLDCTTDAKLPELQQDESNIKETATDSQSVKQQPAQDHNANRISTDRAEQDKTFPHKQHSTLDCTTGSNSSEPQDESNTTENAADSQSVPTKKLYDNENNKILHIKAIDDRFLLDCIQTSVKNVEKYTEILEKIRPLFPHLQDKGNAVEILSVVQLKPAEVVAEKIMPPISIESVQDLLSKDIIFDKTYTFPYLLRYHNGLKRRILSAIVNMNIYEFQHYTHVYNVPDVYNNGKVLQYCYKVTLEREVWPIPLYMRLIDLHKYLQSKHVVYEKFDELRDISPKLLHWDELQRTTDFDYCVRIDYCKCTGQELTDESLLCEWREKYYKRCWAHDEWLWRVPRLNESLVGEFNCKTSVAENSNNKVAAISKFDVAAENMEENISNTTRSIAAEAIDNETQIPRSKTHVKNISLSGGNDNTGLQNESNKEPHIIAGIKTKIQMSCGNEDTVMESHETVAELSAATNNVSVVGMPKTPAQLDILASKQNVAHDTLLDRNTFSGKDMSAMHDSELSQNQLHSEKQQTPKADTKRQESAPSMNSTAAATIKQEFVPLHGLEFYLLNDEEHFACKELTSENIIELDTQSQGSKFSEEIGRFVTAVSPSDCTLDNIQSQLSIESGGSSIPETQPLPCMLRTLTRCLEQQPQSETNVRKEVHTKQTSKHQEMEQETEKQQDRQQQLLPAQQQNPVEGIKNVSKQQRKASNVQERVEPKRRIPTEEIEKLQQQQEPKQANQQQEQAAKSVAKVASGETTAAIAARQATISKVAAIKATRATSRAQQQQFREQKQQAQQKQSNATEKIKMPTRPRKRLSPKKAVTLTKVYRKDDIVPQLTHEFRPLPLVPRSEVEKITNTNVSQECTISSEKYNNAICVSIPKANVVAENMVKNISNESRQMTAEAVATESKTPKRICEQYTRDVLSIALLKSNNEALDQHNNEAEVTFELQIDYDKDEHTSNQSLAADTELSSDIKNFSIVIMPNTQAQIDALPTEQNVAHDVMLGSSTFSGQDMLRMDNSEISQLQPHPERQQTPKVDTQGQMSVPSMNSPAAGSIKQEFVPLHGLDFYLLNDDEHFACKDLSSEDIIELDTQSQASNFSEEIAPYVTIVSPSDFTIDMQSQLSIESGGSSIAEAQRLPSTLETSQCQEQQPQSETNLKKKVHNEQTSIQKDMAQPSEEQEVRKSQQEELKTQRQKRVKQLKKQNKQQQQQKVQEQPLQKRLEEQQLPQQPNLHRQQQLQKKLQKQQKPKESQEKQPQLEHQQGGATAQANISVRTRSVLATKKANTSPKVPTRKSTEFSSLALVSNEETASVPDMNVPQEKTFVYIPLAFNTLSQAFYNDSSLFNNTHLLRIIDQQLSQQQAQLQQCPEQLVLQQQQQLVLQQQQQLVLQQQQQLVLQQQQQLVPEQPALAITAEQYYQLLAAHATSEQQPQATDENAEYSH